MVVVRNFTDIKVVTALLQAAHPVFVVTRTSEEDERRVFDLLAGWALGSGGDLDRIGPNTVIARPANCPPISLSRSGIASAVEEVFAADATRPLSRERRNDSFLRPSGARSVRREESSTPTQNWPPCSP
jgi:FtsZ-interacting cell division protein YlmF